jgi:NADP-dependent 3-hydroxy acid dehydrogenase YdfG
MNELDGASALVTGASAGIGRATAAALASEGADVTLVARSGDRLESIAEEFERDHDVAALPIPADVRDPEAVADAVSTAVERFGGLDVAVSNAGVGGGYHERVDEMNLADYERMMRTNADGSFHVARAALPHLRAAEGYLVFVGSFAGKYPYPISPVYAATKGWVSAFTRSLQAAEGEDGVAVTVINPGGVRTEFAVSEDETQADRYDPGEAIEPEEVAEAIVLAVTRPGGSTVTEVELLRRDQFGGS